MVISASRRTDIPAFYAPWLLRRPEAGFADVRNPYSRRISRVSLSRADVDCLVFWTKDPAPMLGDVLPRISALGYPFYFQFTLTPYGGELEPFVPPKREVLETFRRLSAELGSRRVVWRYDPVVLGAGWTVERHEESFGKLCRAMAGYTSRCVISFVDVYAKLPAATKRLLLEIKPETMLRLAESFAKMGREYGIEVAACCEELDFSGCGIMRSRCIDPALVELAAGHPVPDVRDRGQRPSCGCMKSADIGAYDTCTHGCRYCYATAGLERARRNRALHDPEAAAISG